MRLRGLFLVFLIVSLLVFPAFRFGFVPTAYATTTNYAVTASGSDGQVSGASDVDYATARGTATASSDSGSTLTVGQKLVGDTYTVYRAFLKIDTTALPSTATVSTVIFYFNLSADTSTTDFSITVYSWTGATPIDTDDYNSYGSTSFSSLSTNGIGATKLWKSIVLSTASVTKAGYTYFCIRSSRDVSSTEPTGPETIAMYSYDESTGGVGVQAPYVAVTYTTASSPTYNSVDSYGWVAGSNIVFRSNWTAQTGNLSYYTLNWNSTGSLANDTSVAFSAGLTSYYLNVTKSLSASVTDYVIQWRVYVNNTSAMGNDTGLQNTTILHTLPPISDKTFGETLGGTWYGCYWNGSSEAIYVCYQNSSVSQWVYQVRAYDMNSSAWTLPCTVGNSVGDTHYSPSIAVLRSPISYGHLIALWAYEGELKLFFRISTYNASTETNLTKLISNWGPMYSFLDDLGNTFTAAYSYPQIVGNSASSFITIRDGSSNWGDVDYGFFQSGNVFSSYVTTYNSSFTDWTKFGSTPYLTNSFADYIQTSFSGQKDGYYGFDFNYNITGHDPFNTRLAYLDVYVNLTGGNTGVYFDNTYLGNIPDAADNSWYTFNVSALPLNDAKVVFNTTSAGYTGISKARLNVTWDGFSIFNTLLNSDANISAYWETDKVGNNILLTHNAQDNNNYPNVTQTSLYFMYSADGGVTWKNASGSTLTLPLNSTNSTHLAVTPGDRTVPDLATVDENGKPVTMIRYLPDGLLTNPYGKATEYRGVIAQFSGTLGSAGSWSMSNATDQDGNMIYGVQNSFVMCPEYGRPAFWASGNQTGEAVSRYVRFPNETSKFLRLWSDDTGKVEMYYGHTIRDNQECYEKISVEFNWGALGYTTVGSSSVAVSASNFYGSKFTANETCVLSGARIYANTTGTPTATQDWYVALYNSTGYLMATGSGNLISGLHGSHWLLGSSLNSSASIVNGSSYWIAFYFNYTDSYFYDTLNDPVNGTFMCVGTSFPNQIVWASCTMYNRTVSLVAYPSWLLVRGIGVDEYATSFTATGTNTTYASRVCAFSTHAADGSGLSYANFRTNNTGPWVNTSYTVISGLEGTIAFNETLNNTAYGYVIIWEIWVNDTNNNWASTPTQSLATLPNLETHEGLVPSILGFISDHLFSPYHYGNFASSFQILSSKGSASSVEGNIMLSFVASVAKLFSKVAYSSLAESFGIVGSSSVSRVILWLGAITESFTASSSKSILVSRFLNVPTSFVVSSGRSTLEGLGSCISETLGATSSRVMSTLYYSSLAESFAIGRSSSWGFTRYGAVTETLGLLSSKASTFLRSSVETITFVASGARTLGRGFGGSATQSFFTGTSSVPTANWWSTSFAYREKITLNNSAISENLVNFPVPVVFSSTQTSFWGHVNRTTGSDVRFVDADNSTELYFEVESFDTTNNASLWWVNVPQIDSGSSTDYVWVYYGNSTCAFDSYCSSASVWDSSYVLVLHLNETSGVPIDSNGLQTSSVNTAQQGVSGILGTCYNFTSQYFNITNAASLSGMATLSLEFWTYKTKAQAERAISIHDNAGLKLYHIQTYLDGVSNCSLYGSINNVQYGTAYNVVPLNQWDYIVQRYNGTNIIGYVNNVQVYTGAKTGSVGTTSQPLVVGRNPTTLTSYFSGKLDEIRVSNVSRSAAWHSACYLYEVDQSKFTVAAEEPSSTQGSSSGGASLLWSFARYATVPASFALQTLTSGLAQFVNLAGSVMMSFVAAFSSNSVFSRFSSLSEMFSIARVSGITEMIGGSVAEGFIVLGARAVVLSRSLSATASFIVSGLNSMAFSRFGITPLSFAVNGLKAVSDATSGSIVESFNVASGRLDSLLRFGSTSLSTALSGTRSLLGSVGGVVAEAFDVGTLRSWTVMKQSLVPLTTSLSSVASGLYGAIFTLYSSIALAFTSASSRVLSVIRQGNIVEAFTVNTVHALAFLKGGLASLGSSVSSTLVLIENVGGLVAEAFVTNANRVVAMLDLGSIAEAFNVGTLRSLTVLRYGLTPLATSLSSLAEGMLRSLNLYGLIPELFTAEAGKIMELFAVGNIAQSLSILGLKATTLLKASEVVVAFTLTKFVSGLPNLLMFFGNIISSFNLGSIGSSFMLPYGAGVGDLAMTFFSVAIIMPLVLAIYITRGRRKRD